MMFEDFSEKKIGKLQVLKNIGQNRKKNNVYQCECECGEIVEISEPDLKSGRKKSCGCGFKETQFKKTYNIYDLRNDFGIGMDSKGRKFYFDLDDYDKIKEKCWYVDTSNGYVISCKKVNKILFHLFVLNRQFLKKDSLITIKDDFVVDHMNGDKTDNRKTNLRVCTRSQNIQNQVRKHKNTLSVTGVTFLKDRGKYRAEISVNKERILLGSFENLEDAIAARKEAQEKYFGEFNPDRRNLK